MIWVTVAFHRDCEEKKVEAVFDRVPCIGEEIEVDRFSFRVESVGWAIQLDENEFPTGQAEPYVDAKFIAERKA